MKLVIFLTCIIAVSLPCSVSTMLIDRPNFELNFGSALAKVSMTLVKPFIFSAVLRLGIQEAVTMVLSCGGKPTLSRRDKRWRKFPYPSKKQIDKKLLNFSEELINRDENNVFRFIKINHQGKTESYTWEDSAPNKLLSVNEKAVYSYPTISKFKALLDNYNVNAGVSEKTSPIEEKEIDEFLDAILNTRIMNYAISFLQELEKMGSDPDDRRNLLKSMWFDNYPRDKKSGVAGSSGFEHVFLVEMRGHKLLGLHNWLYFHEAEKQGLIDYKGYMKWLPLGKKGEILVIRSCRHTDCKPITSLFIGTSPELEMAIYTVCFLLRANTNCRMSFKGRKFNVKTYSINYDGKKLIGTAFVDVE